MKPALALLACALLLGGCGAGDVGAGSDAADGRMPVTAAFYPLAFLSERVGGDLVEVSTLTKPGTEPHDLELTPKAVAGLSQARAVVLLAGFQPAVDEAVASQAGEAAVDVTDAAELTPGPGGTTDPHFWLDPTRMAAVATSLGEAFAERDPDDAAAYRANAAALVTDLTALDEEYRTGLASCESTELVTGHAAFGYLAQRYGLGQEGIAGISPDAEPDAATLRELTEHVREAGVTTVYAETLVPPALAETIARETGAKVAVLDPLEGITDASAGADYLEVMRANLRTLREGQSCS
ncbi:zinc ABC transporter substrate-binding protein [Fodinibacter luteus]|uniref:Zinc ABC transporter substrate-binding protein n=1 Tax=Fodinibacter luteus TaxID=552064 RepID=A0ABP8KBM9_9MICO